MDDSNDASQSTAGAIRPRKGVGRIIALVGVLIVAFPIWYFFIGPQMRHDRLVEKGIHARGRLLTVEETGNMVNDSPELKLTVEFTRKDGVLDTATTRFIPSIRQQYLFQDGVGVTAAYDPDDPHDVTIVDLDKPAIPGLRSVTPTQRDAIDSMADSLRRVGDSLRKQIEAMKAKIESEAKIESGAKK